MRALAPPDNHGGFYQKGASLICPAVQLPDVDAAMARLVLLNKPNQVLSQFSDDAGRRTLADYLSLPGVYPAGRLDFDSEGLLLLTDDGALQQRISSPRFKQWKTYLLQLEGIPSQEALDRLRQGLVLKDGPTLPARAAIIEAPDIWPRDPPIRHRESQATSWLEVSIREGRNRQLRRMAAAIGHPVLRLIRKSIGDWQLGKLQPGEHRLEQVHMPTGAARHKGRRRER